jgi:hypothetical protein
MSNMRVETRMSRIIIARRQQEEHGVTIIRQGRKKDVEVGGRVWEGKRWGQVWKENRQTRNLHTDVGGYIGSCEE